MRNEKTTVVHSFSSFTEHILEELIAVRADIFNILHQSSGRWLTHDEFIAFFVGLCILRNSRAHDHQISEENVSEEEKRVVRQFFQSNSAIICQAQLPDDLPKICHQGITQYRVEVVPVFARIIEKDNIRMRNVVIEARSLDRALIEISLWSCKDAENLEYFRQIDKDLIDLEYGLSD